MKGILTIWFWIAVTSGSAQMPDFDAVTTQLRSNGSDEQIRIFESFAPSSDSVAHLPELLELIDKEAPNLDNNGFLLISMILERHPDTRVPIDVFIRALKRRIWTSQQKCLQALKWALSEENIRLHRDQLLRLIIPLTASQRSRVYEPAAECLLKITGEKYGPDPDAWKAYFRRKYGNNLNIRGSIYEMVVVVAQKGDDEFEVNGQTVRGLEGLKAELQGLATKASKIRLNLAVIIRVPLEKIRDTFSDGPSPEQQRLLQAIMVDLGIASLTFSPPEDTFRRPYFAK